MRKRGLTVILANGSFPLKGSVAFELLVNAERIVACDGAANVLFERLQRQPDFVVGDLDSFVGVAGDTIYRVDDQETNDLTKAIDFCRTRGWRRLVIVGATGKREDHTLGNIFRAMEAGVEIITDEGRFIPFVDKLSVRTAKGMPISIFATDPKTKMSSTGLAWKLDGVKFKNLYCATLNRANAKRVTITTNRPAFAFIACHQG